MADGQILFGAEDGTYVFRLVGDIRQTAMGGVGCSTAFYKLLEDACGTGRLQDAVFDCREAVGIDSTYLGLMAQVAVHVQQVRGRKPVLISTRQRITGLLEGMGLDTLFLITDQGPGANAATEVLEADADTSSSKAVILEAHKTLASLNDANRAAFQDVIKLLEQQSR